MADNNENKVGSSLAEAKTAAINKVAEVRCHLIWQRGSGRKVGKQTVSKISILEDTRGL